MKLSLKWLERHVELGGRSPEQIRDDLTMSTAEIESIETFGAGLQDVIVGHVVGAVKHPEADKLTVTSVDTGAGETIQIICGADNVAVDQKVAVAIAGSVLPGGLEIGKAVIRGVESCGMICSEKELGLSEDHSGILVLEATCRTGARLVDAVPMLDHVLDIDNKSINHRPDLWGHYGFARELAAIYRKPLLPACNPVSFPRKGRRVPVWVDNPEACPRYTGVVIENVADVPSPGWIRYLLLAVGQRPINLVVDLTNFVTMDLGQPMHAFDLRHLDAAGVGVRKAVEGETITTLDGVQRQLTTEDLLITTGAQGADRPVALAGVMGGEGSMVGEDTTELFLESANFHPTMIRRTSMRLGLRTDASARFEKSLDPSQAELGVQQFIGLLTEVCPQAEVAGPLEDPTEWSYQPQRVELRRARLDLKLGVEVPDELVTGFLENLQFDVKRTKKGFDVGIPSFRATKDISIEDDLIEEVGRLYRYDNIPEKPLTSEATVPPREPELSLLRQLVQLGAAELSCHEIYNYSFSPDELLEVVGAADLPHSRVVNPVAPEICRVRRHVMPSVLGCLADNLRHRQEVRLMEHGKGYHPEQRDEHGLPHEVHEIAFAFSRREGSHPYGELRSAVEILLGRLGFPSVLDQLVDPDGLPWVHPGRTVAIRRGVVTVGYVGSVHPQVSQKMQLPDTTAIANLDLRALLTSGVEATRFRAIPRFPSQPVDVALLVPQATRVVDVSRFLGDIGGNLVRSVRLFEVYRGAGLPVDHKSLNFTVTLGADDRTLTTADEEEYLSKVRQRAGDVGAQLRG